MTYSSIMVKQEVKSELDGIRKRLSLSWTKFFMLTLPRCPDCSGLIVAIGDMLKCAKCGTTWRLDRIK